MNGYSYMSRVREILGEPPPRNIPSDPEAWSRVERNVQYSFSEDFKEFVDIYAPVVLKHHLYILHPAVDFRSLEKFMVEMIDGFSDVEWEEEDYQIGEGIPRFGVPGGLYPLAGTDRGDIIFSKTGENNGHDCLVVSDSTEGEFHKYEMSFIEWLYRFLVGQSVLGPNSAIVYPGPVALEFLSLSLGERTVTVYGPDLG